MNNYQGYLMRFADTIFPNSYLLEYSSTPDQRMELSAERDNRGNLHRSTISVGKTSIRFTTHIMSLEEKITMQNIIMEAIKIHGILEERKCLVQYWNDETNSYDSGWFYIPDIEYRVMDADTEDIRYYPISIELIEY